MFFPTFHHWLIKLLTKSFIRQKYQIFSGSNLKFKCQIKLDFLNICTIFRHYIGQTFNRLTEKDKERQPKTMKVIVILSLGVQPLVVKKI